MRYKIAAILIVEAAGRDPPEAASEADRRAEVRLIDSELVDPTIARFGGRIFSIEAARTLAEFADPGAALGAALEIQRGTEERAAEVPEARRVALRLALDLAEVPLETSDLPDQSLAAVRHLTSLAAPGGIVVSGAIFRAVGRKKLGAEFVYRGTTTVEATGASIEVGEARPIPTPGAQSPWIVHRRWTLLAAVAAVLLLLVASVVLWRPVLERFSLIEAAEQSVPPEAPAASDP